jgi:hypothetical protein
MVSPQTVRHNLVSTVTQETDYSLLAGSSAEPRVTTNQLLHKTDPNIFAQLQQNTYLQHQQQQHVQWLEPKQNEPLTLKNIELLQKDLEQAYVPLVPSLNTASTYHNPECTNNVPNLCNSQNAGPSLNGKVSTIYPAI